MSQFSRFGLLSWIYQLSRGVPCFYRCSSWRSLQILNMWLFYLHGYDVGWFDGCAGDALQRRWSLDLYWYGGLGCAWFWVDRFFGRQSNVWPRSREGPDFSGAVQMADCLAPSYLQGTVSVFFQNRQAKRGRGVVLMVRHVHSLWFSYFLCFVVVVLCSYSVCLRLEPGLSKLFYSSDCMSSPCLSNGSCTSRWFFLLSRLFLVVVVFYGPSPTCPVWRKLYP